MSTLRNTTLIFLIKRSGPEEKITDVLLAMKKRSFGMGRWNGVGGKLEGNETIEEGALREAKQEIGVDIKKMSKVGELSFYFSHNPAWDQMVHVYLCEEWIGTPSESEEMAPKWFAASDIPFANMWPDDEFWIPEVLQGRLVKAAFTFGEKDIILKKEVRIVEKL